ncbi:MAG: phosphonatase-like hydrolase [Bacteroidota bacterium]
MIKMVVFDMAGTVVDEDNVVYKTVQKALKHGGINVTLEQVLADGAGKEKSKAISDIALKYDPTVDSLAIEAMHQDFLKMLDYAYEELDVVPMSGAKEVFDDLRKRGIYRVLNTGYNKKTAMQLVTKLGWKKDREYDDIITASDVPKTRPYPDMIFMAMELMGISDASTVAKIGDSVIDIEEGKNAFCGITVGITTGAHTREQLAGAHPDRIIDKLTDLLPLVSNGNR